MAGETLYGRRVRVILGKPPPDFKTLLPNAIEVENLRVAFKVSKSIGKEPNTAEVSITNLAGSTRSELQGKGHKLILEAGYEDTIARIFAGDVRTIDHTKAGADWTTKATCGDGERAYQWARISESFAGGTRIADVVKKCAEALGLEIGNAIAAVAGFPDQFVNGYTAHGNAARELDRVLRPLGLAWSIQDGRLQVLKEAEANAGTAIELSKDSGLIGSPEFGSPSEKDKPAVLKVKSLLQPGLKPGDRFSLKSRAHSGFFKANKVEHSGDTAGGDWYTAIEAVPL